jgi:outer membrane immunogenic protein
MWGLRSFTVAVAFAAMLLPAGAADFPVEPIYQPRPVVVVFRWTGVYLGAHVGGGRGFVDENAVPLSPPSGSPLAGIVPLPTSIGPSGWLAGGQIGANYQVDSWVIGIEAQASWARFRGSSTCAAGQLPPAGPPPIPIASNCTATLDSLGTAAVRLGWAFDHLLLYGKGGAAWTNNSYQVTMSTTAGQLLLSTNELRWGWMAGIGVEYAFTDNWSAKVEYNYMDFGGDALRFIDTTGFVLMDTNLRQRINIVKVGVNYRFGVTPILIK